MPDAWNVVMAVIVIAFIVWFGASFFGWATIPVIEQVQCIQAPCPSMLKFKTFAELTGVPSLDLRGNEDEIVACTLVYQPVCGTNGVTYSNQCLASQSGSAIAYQGVCTGQ